MAYEKHTWSCGETVTAELLNHMEEGVEDAQNGYECSEETVVVFDDSVTTEVAEGTESPIAHSNINLSEPLINTIDIVFNGETYTITGEQQGIGAIGYGAPFDSKTLTYDWSDYPFSIMSYPNDASAGVATENAGTYTLKISQTSDVITNTECFEKAAIKASYLVISSTNDKLNKTWNEINDAVSSGKTVYVTKRDGLPMGTYLVTSVYKSRTTYNVSASGIYAANSPDDYPSSSLD